MQRSHFPQRSGWGSSGGRSSVVKISPRKNHVPRRGSISIVFLPCQPIPAWRLIAFQNRSGIDVPFLPSVKLTKEIVDLAQSCRDHIVIIVAPRVSCDFSLWRRSAMAESDRPWK